MKVAANSSAGPVLELLVSTLQVCSVEKVKTILNRAYFQTWHTVYCLLKDFLFYTLIHHRCSIFNTLNSEYALVRHTRDIQLLHCSTYAELSNIQIINFMLKFKYRIMTAKKFLKGTSGAKVNIIFQMLCCYLRKEKNPCKLKALQYHQHSE